MADGLVLMFVKTCLPGLYLARDSLDHYGFAVTVSGTCIIAEWSWTSVHSKCSNVVLAGDIDYRIGIMFGS